jgi:ATP-dependent Clp protease ATP-binding subunit ClpA
MLQEGYDALNGVRPMRRLIQDTIEDHIAEGLLRNDYLKGDIVHVDLKDKELAYNSAQE